MRSTQPDPSNDPPEAASGDDPAEKAAAAAIAGAGGAGVLAYVFFGPVGVLLVGMLGAIATIRNELYDERAEAPIDDEPRMIGVYARAKLQRQRLSASRGERMAERIERIDRERTMRVLGAVFWAELILGFYLTVS